MSPHAWKSWSNPTPAKHALIKNHKWRFHSPSRDICLAQRHTWWKEETMQYRVMNCVCGDTLHRPPSMSTGQTQTNRICNETPGSSSQIYALPWRDTHQHNIHSFFANDRPFHKRQHNQHWLIHTQDDKQNQQESNPSLSHKTRQTKTFARANHVTGSALGI